MKLLSKEKRIYLWENDVPKMAKSLKLPIEEYVDMMKDGRYAFHLNERYAQCIEFQINNKKAKFIKNKNRSSLVDGNMNIGSSYLPTNIRSLTVNGKIKFQASIFTGGNRSCNKDNLLYSLKGCDLYLVCDITSANCWNYILLESNNLVRAAENDRLTIKGWSPQEFYDFVYDQNYLYTIRN